MLSLTKAPAHGQGKPPIDLYVPGLVMDKRDEKSHIYVEQTEHGKKHVVECFVKEGRHIHHKVFVYAKLPPEEEMLMETIQYGCKSRRPYQAGQVCDGSIAAPVFHLYAQLCGQFGIDPVHLYNSNYPNNPISDVWLMECIDHAEWQGVEEIAEWSETAVQLVLQSLTETNLQKLRTTLE